MAFCCLSYVSPGSRHSNQPVSAASQPEMGIGSNQSTRVSLGGSEQPDFFFFFVGALRRAHACKPGMDEWVHAWILGYPMHAYICSPTKEPPSSLPITSRSAINVSHGPPTNACHYPGVAHHGQNNAAQQHSSLAPPFPLPPLGRRGLGRGQETSPTHKCHVTRHVFAYCLLANQVLRYGVPQRWFLSVRE